MPQKKEDLPINVDVDLKNGGTITYANEVIAIIAGIAANEIEGIAGMVMSGGIGDIIGRNRNITRGVKVEIGGEEAAVDLYIIVEYGQPIQKVSREVQDNVKKAIESMTGLHVVRVDVHIQGVSFEKEKKQSENLLEASKQPVLTAPTANDGAAKPESKYAKASKKQTPPAEQPAPKDDPAPVQDKAEPAPAPKEEIPAEEAPKAEPDAAPEQQPEEEPAPKGRKNSRKR